MDLSVRFDEVRVDQWDVIVRTSLLRAPHLSFRQSVLLQGAELSCVVDTDVAELVWALSLVLFNSPVDEAFHANGLHAFLTFQWLKRRGFAHDAVEDLPEVLVNKLGLFHHLKVELLVNIQLGLHSIQEEAPSVLFQILSFHIRS